jgi:hypothetical protein
MKRLVISVALVVTAVFASAAAADTPTIAPFTYTYGAVMTGFCPFDVQVATVISGTRIDFVDESGTVTSSELHVNAQDTFTANGITLTTIPSTFNLHVSYDSSGNPINVATGVIEKIVLPDGSLFISAGLADFSAHSDIGHDLSPDYGNPGDVAAFCAALSP